MASVIDDLAWSEGRRRKALIVVLACLWAEAAPHWLGPVRGLLPAFGLTLMLGGYGFSTLRRGRSSAAAANAAPSAEGVVPAIDVLVAARDEEQVIARLVQAIAGLDYPADRLKLWVMDDGSQDRTPEILNQLSPPIPSCRCGAGPAMPVAVNPGRSMPCCPNFRGIGCWCSMPMQP